MPDPNEIRQRDETKLRRVKTMSLKKFSMTSGPKLRVSIFLRNECIATTRFQILRARLLQGYKWVNGRPRKIQKTTRPDSCRNGAWTHLFIESVTERVQWKTCVFLATLSHASG